MNGIHQSLEIVICASPAEAIAMGYNYSEQIPPPKPIRIKKVVVVRNGTALGNSTVDLILENEDGQKYVCLVTHALIHGIPA